MDQEDVHIYIYKYVYMNMYWNNIGILLEYYSAIKKNEMMPFAAMWVNLENIMQSEISQRKTNSIWYHLYMESKKYNKLVNITKKKQTHRHREQTSGYHWRQGWGRRNRDRAIRGTNYYI